MEKAAKFIVNLSFIDKSNVALAGIEDYNNPLLTWITLVFADDEPNANNQGIKQEEFANLINSMALMPIKASFTADSGFEGHDNATQIGVMRAGQQQGNKIVVVGALYNDEFPDVVDYFKDEVGKGNQIDFSWEIRYKESSIENDIEWLSGTTTKAVTAVKHPAYEGRTPMLTISSIALLAAIEDELGRREKVIA